MLVALAAALSLAGCSGSGAPSASAPATSSTTARGGTPTTAAGGSLAAAVQAAVAQGADPADTDASGTEWLCRPGQGADPCRSDLTATVLPASGPATTETAALPADAPVDCFYVYPTVSGQQTVLADLHIDPAEVAVARAQAARFSQVCRVYAPVYPQLTLYALAHPGQVRPADEMRAYDAVAAAWADYLARYNDGRGVVVIGHSQGAAMVTALLRHTVDGHPAVLRRLVSAIVLGGNVTVPVGGTVGGSFAHIPACTSATETGCVVAYSSFEQAPPAGAFFGRPGLGVSFLLPAIGASPGSRSPVQVLCVNPAAPAGGKAPLTPYFPSSRLTSGLASQDAGAPGVSTPWVTEPGLYSGECLYQDGASWLQVSAPITPGDKRPVVSQTLGPLWGLHQVDVNITLGNLVDLVRRQAAAFSRRSAGG